VSHLSNHPNVSVEIQSVLFASVDGQTAQNAQQRAKSNGFCIANAYQSGLQAGTGGEPLPSNACAAVADHCHTRRRRRLSMIALQSSWQADLASFQDFLLLSESESVREIEHSATSCVAIIIVAAGEALHNMIDQ